MLHIHDLTVDEKRAIDNVRTRFYWSQHRELAIIAKRQGIKFPELVRDLGQIEAMFAILQDQTSVLPIFLLSMLRQTEREAIDETRASARPISTYWS